MGCQAFTVVQIIASLGAPRAEVLPTVLADLVRETTPVLHVTFALVARVAKRFYHH